MVQIRLGAKRDPDDVFKGRAEWLLEALGAYRSHRAGYCLSPKRADIFVKLYKNGWHASRRLMTYWKYMEKDRTPYTFTRHGIDGNLPLKKALELCR